MSRYEQNMKGYTPLMSSLIKSTVWCETTKEVKIMWITVLAQKDSMGEVHSTVAGLAKDSELSIEEARAAIHFLESPDPDSTSKAEDGRRILRLPDGSGWSVVNHWRYRDEMQQIRLDNARRQREKRKRDKEALAAKFPQGRLPTPEESRQVREVENGSRQPEDLGSNDITI